MPMRRRVPGALVAAIFSLLLSLLSPASAPALTFNSAPARYWGHIYKGTYTNLIKPVTSKTEKSPAEIKSDWRINFTNVPDDAKRAIQKAVVIW